MFIALLALLGLIGAPLTISKMEKGNQSFQERQFKETEKKIEKEYGLPSRYTLDEIKSK